MDTLDADNEPLYSRKYKKYMARDIVQFVPFREFRHDTYNLAKEVLTEIPGQVVEFFTKRNIFPKPAKEEDRAKIMKQLSLKKKTTNENTVDAFQVKRKQILLDQCQEMGYDLFELQDVIEGQAIWENSVDLLAEA